MIQEAQTQGIVGKSVTFYSDSQAVLKALSSRWIRSKVVFATAQALNDLGRTTAIQLCWVRGHSGKEGNELADTIAGEAAEGDMENLQDSIPRSSAYYRQAFKHFLYEKWIRRWEGTDILFARQTKIWFPTPSFRKTRRILSLERDQLSRVVRWLTGHAFLGLQNFRCGTVALSFCRLCGEVPERADHLLLRCPRLALLRADCFKSWQLGAQIHWEVDWILKFINDPRVITLESPEDGDQGITD